MAVIATNREYGRTQLGSPQTQTTARAGGATQSVSAERQSRRPKAGSIA